MCSCSNAHSEFVYKAWAPHVRLIALFALNGYRHKALEIDTIVIGIELERYLVKGHWVIGRIDRSTGQIICLIKNI